MIIDLAYKYRLSPNKEQQRLLFNQLFAHNQTWNILLNQSINQFEDNKLRLEQGLEPIFLSSVEQDNMIKSILRNRNISFNTKVVQQTRVAFNNCLKQTIKNFKAKNPNTGMLKFKQSKNFNNQAFQTTKEQYSILDCSNPKFKILRLFKQNFKIRWTRYFPDNAEIKTITISFKDNNFYASFNISYDDNSSFFIPKSIPNDTNRVGMDINIDSIDLGNSSFHKVFNIKDIKLNNLIKKNEKKITRLKRKQSRRVEKSLKEKTKLGKNFKKTQDKINRLSTKNSNIKVFNLHKLVNNIIKFLKDNGINHIIMEDLNVKEMTSKDNVNKVIGKKNSKSMKKNILHISFAMFKEILTYKCAMNGVYVSLVDPKNTSKTCSSCGTINEDLNITKRIFRCKSCGLEIKRDYNSCLNMINKFNK